MPPSSSKLTINTIFSQKPVQGEGEDERPSGQPRPFTAMIDKMLAEERVTSDDREARLGPTVNANFKRQPLSQSAQSNDFRLLLPDVTSNSTTQVSSASGSDTSTPRNEDEQLAADILRPKSRSTPRNPKQAALMPERLSDSEFMEYYKQLTPTDRKKQLNVQKQALMDEQERLKRLLRQQEELLERKHVELQRQQAVQRERLQQFEQASLPQQQQQQQQPPNPYSHVPQFHAVPQFNPNALPTMQSYSAMNGLQQQQLPPMPMSYPAMQQNFALPAFKELPQTFHQDHAPTQVYFDPRVTHSSAIPRETLSDKKTNPETGL